MSSIPPLACEDRNYALIIFIPLIPSMPYVSKSIPQVFIEYLPLPHSYLGTRDTAMDDREAAAALMWLRVRQETQRLNKFHE